MATETWRSRAKHCGLTNTRIAVLTGATESTVSRHFANEAEGRFPRYIETLIVCWETLTGQQQGAVLNAIEALPPARKIKRANNLPAQPGEKPKAIKPRRRPQAR